MLYQLHWQNPENLNETIFVSQGGPFDDLPQNRHQLAGWLDVALEWRRDECPKGWLTLVCNEESEHFVRAAPAYPRIEGGEFVTGQAGGEGM